MRARRGWDSQRRVILDIQTSPSSHFYSHQTYCKQVAAMVTNFMWVVVMTTRCKSVKCPAHFQSVKKKKEKSDLAVGRKSQQSQITTLLHRPNQLFVSVPYMFGDDVVYEIHFCFRPFRPRHKNIPMFFSVFA